MRFFAACSATVLLAALAGGQTARISGRVIEEGRGTPVSGVSVRLSGKIAQVTDSLGRFQFGDVVPGRYIVTAASIGFRLRTVEVVVGGDTTITITMVRRVVSLDTMVVLPRYVRVRGTAYDSASGDQLLQAQATIYPGGKFVGAMNGTFTFDSVAPGPVSIVVEGAEHLPVLVEMDVSGDTSFRVKMGVDSVALRMIALQVRRLEKRAQSVPYQMRSYNRDRIVEHRIMALGDFLAQKGAVGLNWRDSVGASSSGCYFVDDIKVDRGVLLLQAPQLIERVETYRRGGMVRAYTKRYVASLIGRDGLQNVVFVPTGLKGTCY